MKDKKIIQIKYKVSSLEEAQQILIPRGIRSPAKQEILDSLDKNQYLLGKAYVRLSELTKEDEYIAVQWYDCDQSLQYGRLIQEGNMTISVQHSSILPKNYELEDDCIYTR